ncbi:hypothetical protein BDZ91DRAFT_763588 [Kalaharituber pfeilii]|nr:hypothetical protein BDZ91DRAFT_763588 [Kalaharituber pfeilii]
MASNSSSSSHRMYQDPTDAERMSCKNGLKQQLISELQSLRCQTSIIVEECIKDSEAVTLNTFIDTYRPDSETTTHNSDDENEEDLPTVSVSEAEKTLSTLKPFIQTAPTTQSDNPKTSQGPKAPLPDPTAPQPDPGALPLDCKGNSSKSKDT